MRQVDPKIRKLLYELKIVPINIIKNDIKNGHWFIYGELNRRDVLIKIVALTDLSKVSGIYKEALVDNLIEKHNRDLSLPLILKARVLSTGSNEEFAWIIRRYYSGRSLAVYKKDSLLMGYDILQNKYLLNRKKIIKRISDNILALRTLNKDLRKLKIRKDIFRNRYEKDIEEYDVKKIESALKIDLSAQVKLYKENQKEYLNKENIQASIGDLVPANIILREDGNLIFSDFEWFSFDNYMNDAAFLWMFFWRYPKWQKDFINAIILKDNDKLFFRLALVRQIVGWYDPVFHYKGNDKKILKRVEKYKKHVWVKYLVAAGESFEALMKVKK